MTTRKQRAQVAQETLAILEQGQYTLPDGAVVPLAELQQRAVHGTIHYAPSDFEAVFAQRDRLLDEDASRYETRFQVDNITTLSAARQLIEADPSLDVLCLNFASAKNPGGGFQSGAQAQEESLARASGLYGCISSKPAYYETNRSCGTCLYTDHMIYTPQTPVFRRDNDQLLSQPYLASFITAPAVNAGAVRRNEPHKVEKIEATMASRMEKVLSLAVIHGHRALALGAWGCGVFKNDPSQIARWFHWHLIENPIFRGVFQTVVFAVLARGKDRHIIRPFEEHFGAGAGDDSTSCH